MLVMHLLKICKLVGLVWTVVTSRQKCHFIISQVTPRRTPNRDEPVVVLKYHPSYILVKLSRTRATKLNGLEQGIIPVEVLSKTFQISFLVDG